MALDLNTLLYDHYRSSATVWGEWGMPNISFEDWLKTPEGIRAKETSQATLNTGWQGPEEDGFWGPIKSVLSSGAEAFKEAAPGIALVAGAGMGLNSLFGAGGMGGGGLGGLGAEGAVDASLGGGASSSGFWSAPSQVQGWSTTAPETNFGLEALEGAGSEGAFSPSVTSGGMIQPGVDKIGSDWATGTPTGAPGGMLPVDPITGLTLPNLAAASGVAGAVNSGLDGGTGGLWDGISNALSLTGTGTPGSYQFPWGDALKGLIGAYTSNNAADKMSEALKYAADKADPFSAQRPAYQQKFGEMTNDPNLFKNTYGDKLTSMVNDPNVLKTQYSDPLNKIINDPNYFKNPFGNELERRISDPNTFKNQYGTEAGRMIEDPDYFINNPMMLALRDNALNSTQARLSSQVGGDQGSISSRDTLNKSILAAQAPSLQNYFQSLVGGDVNTNQNMNTFLNTLSGANQYTLGNSMDYLKSLGTLDTAGQASINDYMRTLNSANTNQNINTSGYLNTIGEAAGAKVNPAASGNILATGAQSLYNANQQTAGNLGYAVSAIGTGSQPSFLESLYRASQGTSPTNANLGSLFSF